MWICLMKKIEMLKVYLSVQDRNWRILWTMAVALERHSVDMERQPRFVINLWDAAATSIAKW